MNIKTLIDKLNKLPSNAKVVVCATEDSQYGICNSLEFYPHADRYLHPEGISHEEYYVELRYIK